MMNWFKKLWYGLCNLNDLEWLILNAVRDQLEPKGMLLWDAQIAAINKVQRLPDGVESDFYSIDLKTGKPCRSVAEAFPNKQEELLLAKVRLKTSMSEIEIDVWFVKGFLFSLEFKGSANYWLEYLGDNHNFKLNTECEILADLMQNVG